MLRCGAGMTLDPLALAEQLRAKDASLAKMAGTLGHYRAWAAQIQARYQMFNPDAARPARRIYVGGLPANTEDVRMVPCCQLPGEVGQGNVSSCSIGVQRERVLCPCR